MLRPGDELVVDFTTRSPTTGAAANADSTPTGTLVRNGTDTAETVTVTNKATGIYKAAVTIPGGWEVGDVIQVRIAATVATVADNSTIFTSTLDSADSGGALTGARSVTITVTDGTNPLQGATVRVRNGSQVEARSTNASGVVTFSLDDLTWDVTITKDHYSFAPTTLVVDGTETRTYAMTAVSIPAPGSSLQTTAYATIYDANGDPLANQTVSFELVSSDKTAGRGYDVTAVTATSNGSGLIQVALLKSTRYRARYGDRATQFTTGTDSTFPIPEFTGTGS